MDDTKIIDVPEERILRWLFSDPIPRLTIVPRLGLRPNAPIRFSVTSPFIPTFGKNPGDIDGLGLIDPDLGTAVAIEAKRLKIKPEAFSTGSINKLPALDKGAQQANSLFSFGFARTMLVVITVVDSSELTGINEIFRVPTVELNGIVNQALESLSLEPGIGLFSITAVQNTDGSFRNRGGLSPQIMRAPIDRSQPDSLSLAVREYFNG